MTNVGVKQQPINQCVFCREKENILLYIQGSEKQTISTRERKRIDYRGVMFLMHVHI